MADKKSLPDRIYNISEKSFWNSVRVPVGSENGKLLRQAIRMGRAGKRAAAYGALNDYHRVSLADEWDLIKKKAGQADKPDRSLLTNLFKGRIVVAHGMAFQFDDRIDFTCLDHGVDALLWLQGTGWANPMITHFLQTGDSEARDFLRKMVLSFYDSRNKWNTRKMDGHYAYGSLGYNVSLVERVYLGMLRAGDVPPDVTEALMKYFLGAGRVVYDSVKRFIIHNIHTAGCCGLLHASRSFPEFKDSVEWNRTAVRHLIRHSKDSFFDDGCHQERCWGYGAHTLGRLISVYHESKRFGGLGPRQKYYVKNLRHAARWFAKTAGPGFVCPGHGDDGGFDCTYVLKQAQTIFPRGAALDLGVDRTKSYFMKPSGFVVMRNGDSRDSIYGNVSFGVYAGWHAHFDSLSMNIRSGQTSLLEELGRFGSYGHGLDHIFRSPEAHNQLLVDGHPYDNRYQESCGDIKWHSDERIDYFSATHRAYSDMPGPDGCEHRCYVAAAPLIVRRTVVFVKNPGYFVVMDSVRPDGEGFFCRAISGWWHSPAPFKILSSTSVRTSARTGCLLMWAHEDGLNRLEPGWDYDQSVEQAGKETRYSLRARRWFSQTHTGINGFTTVIVPFKGKVPSVVVRSLETAGGILYRNDAVEVTTPSGRDVFVLNPERLPGFRFKNRVARNRAEISLGRRRGSAVVR